MNSRTLNILLVFFITLLAVNFLLPTPAKNTAAANEVSMHAWKSSYFSPELPVLTIKNSTPAPIQIDTCHDITIQKNYTPLANLPKEFCKNIAIASGDKATLDLNPLYELFQTPAQYDFRLAVDGKTTGVSINEEMPGFFRSLFRNIFYAPIFNLFAFLLSVIPGHNFGLAIILVTVTIRLILLIPQHHILANSKKMQAIQPKIKELQEKYKGDQAKIGMELMALYKEEQVNPLGSCLPLLIQMPLLLVLYSVVLGITNFSNYYYLYSFLKDFDITKIDTVFFGIHLLSIGGITGIVLALAVGWVQWLQIKLSLPKDSDIKKLEKMERKILEKKDGKYEEEAPSMMPDPSVMNAFMLWGMPLMIATSTYFFPAGVGIYWFIGTLFMLLQQLVVNKIADRKAKEMPVKSKKTKKDEMIG